MKSAHGLPADQKHPLGFHFVASIPGRDCQQFLQVSNGYLDTQKKLCLTRIWAYQKTYLAYKLQMLSGCEAMKEKKTEKASWLGSVCSSSQLELLFKRSPCQCRLVSTPDCFVKCLSFLFSALNHECSGKHRWFQSGR